MNDHLKITRIDPNDPKSIAAVEAEKKLFAHYGLDYKVHTVELKDPPLRVRVLEAGSGEPVLMVPGSSGDACFFAPLMAELKGWRFIAVNCPGGGMSDGIDHRQVDLSQFAVQVLSSVMDAFGLKSAPIIGNSMGGHWAFRLALAHPERVTKMAQLGCPALILNTSAPFFMRLISVPGVNRFILPNMQPRSLESGLAGLRFQGSSPEAIAAMPKVLGDAAYHFYQLPTYLGTWESLISAITTWRGAKSEHTLGADQLKRVHQAVQFIWGDTDPFGGLDVARQAVGLMPNAKLHEMKCGHLPFLDDPVECGRVIREFLWQ